MRRYGQGIKEVHMRGETKEMVSKTVREVSSLDQGSKDRGTLRFCVPSSGR